MSHSKKSSSVILPSVAFHGSNSSLSEPNMLNLDIDGSPLTYSKAKAGPNHHLWLKAESEEFHRLINSSTIRAINKSEQPIERRKDTTYYNPQVKEKILADGTKSYRIRGTIGGDRINYDGETAANTAAMTLIKMLLQSVISENVKWCTLDIKDFYLDTPLHRPEYLRIMLKFIPPDVIESFSLQKFIVDDSILFEVNKGMYGLPQAGLLAQQQLIMHLAKYGYHQTSTPCFFRHQSNGTAFSLVVDDFGVKYTCQEGIDHLITTLKLLYEIKIDWTGNKYLGFNINFNRINQSVELSMPGYIEKVLRRFAPQLSYGSASPSIYTPPSYGSTTPQQSVTEDGDPLDSKQRLRIQEIIGCLLYYARGVDCTILPAVTALASEQANATSKTLTAIDRVLSYCARYPNNILVLHACEMILYIQSDASYLSRSKARSVAGGIFYLGNRNQSTIPNGAVLALSSIIPCVVASVGEAEYAAVFLNGQEGEGLRQQLENLGYPQPPTLILCDNQCAVGLATDTVKIKRTKSIDMRFHWIRDRIRQGHFLVNWRPGADNLADFFTKPLPVHTHQAIMPLLVRIPTSPHTVFQSRHSNRSKNHNT
jgi:hypothetical protein